MSDEPQKKKSHQEWLTEAVAILEKKTLLLVQFEHLAAVAREHAQAVANNETLSHAIAALLSHKEPENGVHALPVKGVTMRGMKARMPVVNVITGADKADKDSVLITMKYARPLTVAEPGRPQ